MVRSTFMWLFYILLELPADWTASLLSRVREALASEPQKGFLVAVRELLFAEVVQKRACFEVKRLLPSVGTGLLPPDLRQFKGVLTPECLAPKSDSVDAYLRYLYVHVAPCPEFLLPPYCVSCIPHLQVKAEPLAEQTIDVDKDPYLAGLYVSASALEGHLRATERHDLCSSGVCDSYLRSLLRRWSCRRCCCVSRPDGAGGAVHGFGTCCACNS